MIEYENIFNDRFIMYKTIPMEANITMKLEERLCSTCKYELAKFKCSSIGKIKFPDSPYCSWWKEKYRKIIKSKRCFKCGEVKPIGEFYKMKSNSDGHSGKCNKCANEYGKEYQRNNKKVRESVEV